MTEMTSLRGAQNLLQNCAGAGAGDRLLIAYEPAEFGYFDADSVSLVEQAAKLLGLEVETVDVGFNGGSPHLMPELLGQFESADIILFLARLGDQLRFSQMPTGKKIIVSFAVTKELFASGFGNSHHNAFIKLKSAVNRLIDQASKVHITCPLGTDVRGEPQMNLEPEGDTSILRFPMSVFTPVPAHTFSGKVALKFLTGTGSKYYEHYTQEFVEPVFALLKDGQLTGFEGSAGDVANAEAQYDRVAELFDIDRNFVHSWHAGIHPGCGYPWDMRDNFERWGGAAFGNPRILHFHTCGTYAPGEISWNVIDPTVTIDDVNYWDNGVFHAERLADGPAVLSKYPCAALLFKHPDRDIGLRNTG